MNRLFVSTAVMFGVSSLLLDSAIKGTAILMLAILGTIFLKRDSAATRHLVWVVAIVAILVVPVFTVILPQWQVLPTWVAISKQATELDTDSPSLKENEPVLDDKSYLPAQNVGSSVSNPVAIGQFPSESNVPHEDGPVEHASTIPNEGIANSMVPEESQVGLVLSMEKPNDTVPATSFWNQCFLIIWLAGFCFWILRLAAARLVLFRSERQAIWIGSWSKSGGSSSAIDDLDASIFATFEACCQQLGVRQRTRLLIHSDRTIPLVWGVLSFRLLLPAASRNWTQEQIRSVILHELGHIKRRDTIVQLLSQFVCALHWFNPLVWFAAWRIHVEREAACDDLVLESGVRASAYAEHLLHVTTRLSQQQWTSACGLAMATNSPLESRLVAILSGGRNRRKVTATLVAFALLFGMGIAIPVAMLRGTADDELIRTYPQELQQPKTENEKAKPNPQNDGISISVATEQKLKWGKKENGLRMALAWPPSLNEKAMGKAEEFYLVVQNVSKKPIRLQADDATPNPRMLIIRKEGIPLSAMGDKIPMPIDELIEPRNVVFIKVFHSAKKVDGKPTVGAAIEGSVRQDPRFGLTAEMTINQAEDGAWSGKLKTGETRCSLDVISPKNNYAKLLFKSWESASRVDGKIPGALIGSLRDSVNLFISYNPTWKTTPELKKFLPEFDSSRDWVGQDAVALLDKLAAIQASPISMALDAEQTSVIRTGFRLPAAFESAPWGDALENGLRHAWMWEPEATKHRIGTALKARVLIHNSGDQPVVFRTRNWHQVKHQATDDNEKAVESSSTRWTTRGLLLTYRLGPGEFVELAGPGVGIGPKQDSEDWQDYRVGTWIQANAGDKVTLNTAPLPLRDWNQKTVPANDSQWWQNRISDRLSRHLPFPKDKDARRRLLHRVAIEVFGTSARMDSHAAFIADAGPNTLESMAKRLASRPGFQKYQGEIQTGSTQFVVLPVDPHAETRPRVVTGPGRYTLGENIRLVVTRSLKAEVLVNQGSVTYYPRGKANVSHDLQLPKGFGTWAAAWIRSEPVLWVSQNGLLRKIDFSNPSKILETRFQADTKPDADVPADIRKSLATALSKNGLPSKARTSPPAATQSSPNRKPEPNEKSDRSEKANDDKKIKSEALHGFWKGTVDGMAFNLSFHRPPASSITQADLYVGKGTIGMPMSFKFAADGRSVSLISGGSDGKEYGKLIRKGDDELLLTLAKQDSKTSGFVLTRAKRKTSQVPEQKEPRELFLLWKKSALTDGKISGEKIGQLAETIRKYVKEYPSYFSSKELPKLLHRFDHSRNWNPAEVVKLLNDVAYYSTKPIEALLPKAESDSESTSPEKKKKVDEYAYGGMSLEVLNGRGVMWSTVRDGLSLGYRVTGNQWRILGKDLKVELWVLNSSKEDVTFRSLNRQDEGLRVKLTGKDGRAHYATMVPNDVLLFGNEHKLPPAHCVKVNEFKLGLVPPLTKSPESDRLAFLVPPGDYEFQCELAIPGYSATGRNGKKRVPVDGEWKGKLTTRGLNVKVVAADAPPVFPKPEWTRIRIGKDGGLSLDRRKMTLDELRNAAASINTNRFIIEANEKTAYQKVIEVVAALQTAGAKNISFRQARMGDGKYRVANLQGSYKLDEQRRISVCRPGQRQHWFTVSWPASDSWPKSWLKIYPNVRVEDPGNNWAVVWEPGTDVVWWIDKAVIGKLTITDPARVIMETEGRTNNFSREFGLPEGVRRVFKRLGFSVGRDGANELENVIGGNLGGRKILSAEHGAWSIIGKVTDADGNPLPNVPVRVTTDRELMTVTTDEQGKYRAYFSLPLDLLARWRGVAAEPMLEGFHERDLSKHGAFNLHLFSGEKPQRKRIGRDKNFKPGIIPRFAERDLVASRIGVSPGKPGRADFVMLKSAEVVGELVNAEGKPASEHWISVESPGRRKGHNVAIEKCDSKGRFRLTGIPLDQELIFTVNPHLKPNETTSSASQTFDRLGKHAIKIVLPDEGRGDKNLKVIRKTTK